MSCDVIISAFNSDYSEVLSLIGMSES